MAEQTQPGQTTRGQKLKAKPPEMMTLYAPDGTTHHCAPVDAREILASGAGYTTEPPEREPAKLTGADIFDKAQADVAKLGAEREQQSKQLAEPGDPPAGAEAAKSDSAKDESGDQGDGKPAATTKTGQGGSRRKSQVGTAAQSTEKS